MRKLVIMIMIVAGALVLFGCQQNPPVPPPGTTAPGGVAVNPGAPGQTGTVNMNTPQGNVAISGKAGVTEAELGVPFYPNAKMDANGGGTITSAATSEGKGGSLSAVNMTTTDPPDAVINFYTGKLGKPSFDMNTADGRSAMWSVETPDKKGGVIVTIATEKDKPGIVTIAILKSATQ